MSDNLETAMQCLELAVRPTTPEHEALAGVRGFHRLVKGQSLNEVCLRLFTTQKTRETQTRLKDMLKVAETEISKLKSDFKTADKARLAAEYKADLFEANSSEKPTRRQQRDHRAPNHSWSQEQYQQGLRLFMDNKAVAKVGRELGINEGQVCRKFINNGPDEDMMSEAIIVQHSGPMTFLELWKIGHDLYGTGWRKKVELRFNLGSRSIGWRDPTFTQGQQDDLRNDWHKLHRSADPI